MQKNTVSYTLDYLNKNGSKQSIKENARVAKTDVIAGSSGSHAEELLNIISSELGISQNIDEEKSKKKPKKKLNLKVYAEEISNIFKEEAERVRLEEEKAELERIEKIARKKIEEEAARIKLEEEKALNEKIKKEAERIRLEELALLRLKQEIAEKAALEEAAAFALSEKEVLNEEVLDITAEEITEQQTNVSYYAKKEPKALNENPVDLQNVVNNGDFVTFKDLQKHYVDFINKIQMQLASVGGGGEVLLKRLDDLDFNTFSDGYVIKYDQQTKKFYGAQESLSAEVLDGGEF